MRHLINDELHCEMFLTEHLSITCVHPVCSHSILTSGFCGHIVADFDDRHYEKNIFTITTFVLAFLFWVFDSSVHYFIYKEPRFEIIPSEFNELWMRVLIVVMAMLFGMFADCFTSINMLKEKQLEVVRAYGSMIHVSNEILINLLTRMKLFKSEAVNSKDFDRDVIDLYDNAIRQASEPADAFSHIEGMSAENIKDSGDN